MSDRVMQGADFLYSQSLQLARESRGMSLTQLSKQSCIPARRLSKWEKTLWTVPVPILAWEMDGLTYVLRYPPIFFRRIIQRWPPSFVCLAVGE
jgi:transcriptional regulator with XRE-family HTH domain